VHHYQDLITLFNNCFLEKYNTQLIKGENEPLYLPADENLPHNTIFFAHGYFASALHECSHWLIAGKERRKFVDFGYWYASDGRTAEQQVLFQKVEVKPQATEWILSQAANFRFRISLDNLDGLASNNEAFKEAIFQQVKTYCGQGLAPRTESFRRALCHFYGSSLNLQLENFDIQAI
jgi:elongation factor P hydroxylase